MVEELEDDSVIVTGKLSDELKLRSKLSAEKKGAADPETEQMPPLFFFLASSFNVELVYIILKGITQFSYLTCNNGKCELSKMKAAKMNLTTEADGSKTVTMHQVKIKDFDKWSNLNKNEKEKVKVNRSSSEGPQLENFDLE